ncbi:MAG TPA: hypothetical protein VGB30_08870 [bacterium]|jgi:hypothetical protein
MANAGKPVITEGFHHWIFLVLVLVIVGIALLIYYLKTAPVQISPPNLAYPAGTTVTFPDAGYNYAVIDVTDPSLYETDEDLVGAIYAVYMSDEEYFNQVISSSTRFVIRLRIPEQVNSASRTVQYSYINPGPGWPVFYDLLFYGHGTLNTHRLILERAYVDVTPGQLRMISEGRMQVADLTEGEPYHHVPD